MTLQVGSIVEGVVTGITSFGAFVLLPGGKTGLVHISEVSDSYVKDINDYLKQQDKVKVKILSMDESGKVGLSIRQANPNASRTRGGRPRQNQASFEDRLQKFMKESDERLTDLRRKTDSKRGGRGRKGDF